MQHPGGVLISSRGV